METFMRRETKICPRDWRLLASVGEPIKGPLKIFEHHGIMIPRGLRRGGDSIKGGLKGGGNKLGPYYAMPKKSRLDLG